MTLQWEAHQFATQLADPAVPGEHLRGSAQDLLDGFRDADPADTAAALAAVAGTIPTVPAGRALLAAMVCGAVVEAGVDAGPVVGPLTARLRQTVSLASRFYAAAIAAMPAAPATEDEEAGIDDEAFDKAARSVAKSDPQAAEGWGVLEQIFPPVVAIFGAAPAARAAARAELVPALQPLAAANQGAHWIIKLLGVLNDEPYVAIEPSTGRGIAGRFGGVSENFQLHVLLMDAFPRDAKSKRRVSAAAAAVARGEGPQSVDEVVIGAWNPYAWTALRPDRTLPDATDLGAQEHWIWNEGTPAEIPTFDGVRVVLLGPPGYERSWAAQRDFASLPAELAVDKELSAGEVAEWLGRIAGAPRRP